MALICPESIAEAIVMSSSNTAEIYFNKERVGYTYYSKSILSFRYFDSSPPIWSQLSAILFKTMVDRMKFSYFFVFTSH